jgi:hypothetical protein
MARCARCISIPRNSCITPSANTIRTELLARRIRALLAALGEPGIDPWLAVWPTRQQPPGTAAAAPVRVQHALSVLRWLPIASHAAPPLTAELCELLSEAARDLEWRQTYTQADVASGAIDAAFLDRYGWCEVIGPRAASRSDRMACGFLLLGPDTHYPSHRHDAEEIYVPLSGTAAWWQGRGDRGDGTGEWRQRPPGSMIHYASCEPHAMRTHADPLLALYVWRGGDVRAEARLDAH